MGGLGSATCMTQDDPHDALVVVVVGGGGGGGNARFDVGGRGR